MPRAFESRQLGDRAQRPGSEMALRAIWSSSIRGTRGRPATTCLCRQVPLRCSRGRGLRLYLRLYSLSRRVSAQAQISKIQDAGDAYTRKVELEKRRIDELDRQMEVTPKPAALHACKPLTPACNLSRPCASGSGSSARAWAASTPRAKTRRRSQSRSPSSRIGSHDR